MYFSLLLSRCATSGVPKYPSTASKSWLDMPCTPQTSWTHKLRPSTPADLPIVYITDRAHLALFAVRDARCNGHMSQSSSFLMAACGVAIRPVTPWTIASEALSSSCHYST